MVAQRTGPLRHHPPRTNTISPNKHTLAIKSQQTKTNNKSVRFAVPPSTEATVYSPCHTKKKQLMIHTHQAQHQMKSARLAASGISSPTKCTATTIPHRHHHPPITLRAQRTTTHHQVNSSIDTTQPPEFVDRLTAAVKRNSTRVLDGHKHNKNLINGESTTQPSSNPSRENTASRAGIPNAPPSPGTRTQSYHAETREQVATTKPQQPKTPSRGAEGPDLPPPRPTPTQPPRTLPVPPSFAHTDNAPQDTYWMPSDPDDIFPCTVNPPPYDQSPRPLLLRLLQAIAKKREQTPAASPFIHERTQAAAEHNSQIIASHGYDLERCFKHHQDSLLSPGSEFRHPDHLQHLLGRHGLWPRLYQTLTNGASYPLKAIPFEPARLQENEAMIKRGNHKSASQDKTTLHKHIDKDVTKGYAIPITVETARKIKNSRIAPVGIQKQWTINAQNQRVIKKRLTHDQSFSLDHCPSVNHLTDCYETCIHD